jgi:hypothetical protein
MVQIERDKIIIEIKTIDPEQLYRHLLTGIPTCIQAIAESGIDERDRDLPVSLFAIIEFYKQLLPSEKQIEKMLKKGK